MKQKLIAQDGRLEMTRSSPWHRTGRPPLHQTGRAISHQTGRTNSQPTGRVTSQRTDRNPSPRRSPLKLHCHTLPRRPTPMSTTHPSQLQLLCHAETTRGSSSQAQQHTIRNSKRPRPRLRSRPNAGAFEPAIAPLLWCANSTLPLPKAISSSPLLRSSSATVPVA